MKNTTYLLQQFFDLELIKFGNFTLKSGVKSPFYVDLRAISSKPMLLKNIANALLEKTNTANYNLICGVPYAALPLATIMSVASNIPLIIKRKQSKGYGTNKLIEGIYSKGDTVLVVEDVVTSGKSLLETIPQLEAEGLLVKDIVIVVDRQQGGRQLLEKAGYRVHVLFSIEEVVKAFYEENRIDASTKKTVLDYVSTYNKILPVQKRKTFVAKLKLVKHPISIQLLHIALEKKSNLICAADVDNSKDLLALADQIGQHIVALKMHLDILTDFDDNTKEKLQFLAKKHNFLLFEDRKYADIGNTASLQFSKGNHQISNWVSMVTAHVIAGEGSVVALKNTAPNVGIIPIVQMSSKGSLTDTNYANKAMQIVNNHKDAIIGIVAQDQVISDDLLKFTPGINFNAAQDDKGQSYNNPKIALHDYKTDFIIVGRGIYQADSPKQAAKKYQITAWEIVSNN
jgi:uridine monophosphate synthetase